METAVMTRIKKDAVFSIREGSVKVIDTFRNYVFGQVRQVGGRVFYDILTAAPDPFDGVKLETSRSLVGLAGGTVDGSDRQPLPLSVMQQKWTDFVVNIGIQEASKREADAARKAREDKFAELNAQKLLAREFKQKCEDKLRQLSNDMPLDKFINNKDVRGLMAELQLANFYLLKKI